VNKTDSGSYSVVWFGISSVNLRVLPPECYFNSVHYTGTIVSASKHSKGEEIQNGIGIGTYRHIHY
jgi:hypothetical protein